MKNYHFDAPILDSQPLPEYFATEVVSAHQVGPCTRLVFAVARVPADTGKPHREGVVAVVLPPEMVAMFAEHIRTGIPARAQAFTAWDNDGEPTLKGH
jgi:hypothetical protein